MKKRDLVVANSVRCSIDKALKDIGLFQSGSQRRKPKSLKAHRIQHLWAFLLDRLSKIG
jgi:hypothetical protein